jgi:hypothetical protein
MEGVEKPAVTYLNQENALSVKMDSNCFGSGKKENNSV